MVANLSKPAPSHARPTCPRGAFTLLELLVVIGVLSVLMGILIPSLAGARERSRQVACAANLRQWAFAAIAYSQSFNGFLPRRGNGQQPTADFSRAEDWFNALPPIIDRPALRDLLAQGASGDAASKAPWFCPSNAVPTAITQFSYSMNMWLSTTQAARPDRIDLVAPTQCQVFMADGPREYGSTLPSDKPYSPVARHRNNLNISFLDGHVSGYSGAYVGCGVGDPVHTDIQWIVPNSSWAGPKP